MLERLVRLEQLGNRVFRAFLEQLRIQVRLVRRVWTEIRVLADLRAMQDPRVCLDPRQILVRRVIRVLKETLVPLEMQDPRETLGLL